jgi:hypothetical protein
MADEAPKPEPTQPQAQAKQEVRSIKLYSDENCERQPSDTPIVINKTDPRRVAAWLTPKPGDKPIGMVADKGIKVIDGVLGSGIQDIVPTHTNWSFSSDGTRTQITHVITEPQPDIGPDTPHAKTLTALGISCTKDNKQRYPVMAPDELEALVSKPLATPTPQTSPKKSPTLE